MKKIIVIIILMILISILYQGHTITTEYKLCTNCGKSKKTDNIYFYNFKIQYKPSLPIKTIENRLYNDLGGPHCDHKWKVIYTSSSGWLGNYDGPLGDYGLNFEQNENMYKFFLDKLQKLPTIEDRIKMIFKLRYNSVELEKWLEEFKLSNKSRSKNKKKI